jgi:TonB-dependent starch-binding outer membrane protein SusC
MKRLLYNLLIPGLLMLGFVEASAQRSVSGTVRSGSDNQPLLGATILVKGSSVGTVTDFDGTFQIQASNDDILVVSYTGYTQIEVAVGAQTNLNIVLQEASELLSEVVVVGYTAQQKRDLTGAVGIVNTEQLKAIPSSNITNQLQGRISGVTISGDGRPGQPAKVRIRGFSSFSGANDPLYVVDGVPTQDISTLNPNDIENMSVLKDAGAASIYGSRASNGVILITTKQGSRSGVKVSYENFAGFQDPGKGPQNLLNTQQYADLQWLVYRNDGTSETHPVYGPSSNSRPTIPSWAGDENWYDILTRRALIMNHDLSLSSGNENSSFYAGLNYFNQEGIVLHNFSKRYSARINSSFKIANGRITVGENLTVTGRTGNGVAGNRDEGSPIAMGVYRNQPITPAIIKTPVQGTGRLFQPGDYGGTGIAPRLGNGNNVLANLERGQDNRQNDVRVLGSAFMDVSLMKGLTFKTVFGGTYQTGYNTGWTQATYERAENIATSSYNENAYYNSDWVWTNTLSYDKTFGSHVLRAVAGYESVKYGIGRSVSASRAGYFSNDYAFRTVSNGSQITAANSGFGTPTTLISTFARADYSFNNRYYLSGTVRRDGSSRFGPEFRYGVFPSVSGGVRVSDFMNTDGFLNDLKIRGGYGTMGNQLPVNPANQFSLFGGGPGSSFYDLNGSATSSLQGFRPTRIGNADSKWETQVTTNIGFDASLFDSKVQVSLDWYRKDSRDLLVTVPLPAIYGAAAAPALNVGDMKNSGLDLQVDYRTKITNDLSLDATLTFTTYKNEIVRYAEGIDFFDSGGSRIGPFNRNEVGRSISEFFGYQVRGLFQNQAEVDGAARQSGAEPGFFRFEDINGDGNISPADRTYIGNPNPDFTYGLNLGLNYKNFNVTAFFYGSQGNEIFNYNRWWTDFWPSFQGQKSTDLLLNSWTPSNPTATVPKASNKSNFSTNTQSTSYYVEDGSFLRLRNLQFGYTVPASTLKPLGISNLSVYVQGVNLFTLTKYSGLDPDLNNSGDTAFGVDEGNYPLVKQYLIGVRVGF